MGECGDDVDMPHARPRGRTLDLTVKVWNPAAERIFGWKEQKVFGRPNPRYLFVNI
jgi:PAS domain-containing protein